MPQLLSLHSRAQELPATEACALQQEKPLQWEASAPKPESSPHSPQLEKACAQQWRPSAAKSKYINKFLKQSKTGIEKKKN